MNIKEAKPLAGHHLWVRFEDGMEGEIDLSDLVQKGVFKILQDPERFNKVTVDEESGTVIWPGGLDLAPDALYEDLRARNAA